MHVSPDIEQQITRKVETYGSVDNVLAAALEALEDKEQLEYERAAVLEGVQELENGQSTTYTDETLNNLFEKIKADGRERLSNDYERQAILDGIKSGDSILAEKVFAELRQKYSRGCPSGFFDQTYGSCEDDPIVIDDEGIC